MPQDLHRLVYRSVFSMPAEEATTARELDSILETSRRNNSAAGLTGALLHSGAQFVQVLEGPLPAIEAVYDRIAADLRHTSVELLQFTPVPEPSFPAWSMAFVPQDRIDGVLALEAVRTDTAPEVIEAGIATLARILAEGARA